MNDITHARLEGELTIYTATEVQQQLLQVLSRAAGAIALDLSDVSETDTAGVQLLLAAQTLAGAQDQDFNVSSCSESVREAASLLGAWERLGGKAAVASAA